MTLATAGMRRIAAVVPQLRINVRLEHQPSLYNRERGCFPTTNTEAKLQKRSEQYRFRMRYRLGCRKCVCAFCEPKKKPSHPEYGGPAADHESDLTDNGSIFSSDNCDHDDKHDERHQARSQPHPPTPGKCAVRSERAAVKTACPDPVPARKYTR
jgi:hypothetical protein